MTTTHTSERDMTDKELLELAAKAAGIPLKADFAERYDYYMQDSLMWNPLTNDGDALRLAVRLKIPLQFPDWTNITRTWGSKSNPDAFDEPHNDDPYAATRRAIEVVVTQIAVD